MSATPEINRANARLSTGPRTPEGKTRSSLNALRHGLSGQIVVMPSEDLAAYQRHVRSFLDEYQPATATESQLVQALADAAWRLNRIVALETNLLAHLPDPLENALAQAAAALENTAAQSKALANLSLHSQRLSRQFERTVAQLRALQEERRASERRQMNDLLAILEDAERHGESYDPSEDGFVFSEQQIAQAQRLRTRAEKVRHATFCS